MNNIDKIRDLYIDSFSGEQDELLSALERETHQTQLHPRMLSGWHQSVFLSFLIKLTNAKSILEIGTFSAYATICMARALEHGGKITTIERNDEIEWLSSKYIALSGLGDKIESITGDAKKVIPALKEEYDFVFIDGDKREYLDYYKMILPKVKSKGLIIADNVLWDDKIFKPVVSNDFMTKGIIKFNEYIKEDHHVRKIILPLRDGLMLLQKI